MPLFLTEEDVLALADMDLALAAVEEVFQALAAGEAVTRPRQRARGRGSLLHLMGGAYPRRDVLGYKAYVSSPQGTRFHVWLYDVDSGESLALIQADHLGRLRTGAASGVATRYLARRDARVVGMVGAGRQAKTQLEAVCRVRPIEEVRVFSPTPERRSAFASHMSEVLRLPVRPVEGSRQAVTGADVVITITGAREPVLEGRWLAPGSHVNAAGSNAAARRELDEEAVTRAGLITVDDPEQARSEAGDLIGPAERGLLAWERVVPLAAVVAGQHPGREGEEQITLFESQGIAAEDLALAERVYRLARERGVGRQIDL